MAVRGKVPPVVEGMQTLLMMEEKNEEMQILNGNGIVTLAGFIGVMENNAEAIVIRGKQTPKW